MAELRRHPKGHPVRFKNPTTGEYTEGCCVLEEVWATAPESFKRSAGKNAGWRQPAFLAQLIDWYGTRRVRVTYYVRPEGGGRNSWKFAGQYSPLMSLKEFRSLLKGLKNKRW